MTSKSPSTRKFFREGFYSLQSDSGTQAAGALRALPAIMRLHLLCQAQANIWGHAAFRRGELITMVGCSAPTLRAIMQKLVNGQVIAPQSSELCVVLNADMYRRRDKRIGECKEPAHDGLGRCLWAPRHGWKSMPEWNAILDNVTVAETVTTTTARIVTGPADGVVKVLRCQCCGRSDGQHPADCPESPVFADPWTA